MLLEPEPALPYFRPGDRVRHRRTGTEGVIVRECGSGREVPVRQFWDVQWDGSPTGFGRLRSADELELVDGS